MRLYCIVFIALFFSPVVVTAQENLGTYEDRMAVEDVMTRYVWAVDSLDAEGYVAVFTEDAIIDSNGNISKGHEEIRKIVTNLIKWRDENREKGLPASSLHHVISNVRITFPKPGEALHQSYASRQGWQDDHRRDGPFQGQTREARWQVVNSGAKADRLHRLIIEEPHIKNNSFWVGGRCKVIRLESFNLIT